MKNIAKYLDILLLFYFIQLLLFSVLFATFSIFYFVFLISTRYIRLKVPGDSKFYFPLYMAHHIYIYIYIKIAFIGLSLNIFM